MLHGQKLQYNYITARKLRKDVFLTVCQVADFNIKHYGVLWKLHKMLGQEW
jgi:hypothetical protein